MLLEVWTEIGDWLWVRVGASCFLWDCRLDFGVLRFLWGFDEVLEEEGGAWEDFFMGFVGMFDRFGRLIMVWIV